MKLAWVTALIPLAACGRAGFNPVPDALSPAVLDCAAAPPSFALAANVQEIAATSTTDGYAVFITDDKGAVTGLPFALSATDPRHTPVAQPSVPGLATGADNRQLGAFASGDDVELVVPQGPAGAPTGFTRIPLTSQLAARGAEDSVSGWTAQAGSIAFSTAGVGVYLQQTTGVMSPTVQASTVAAPGAALSAPVTLKQTTDQIFGATVTAVGDKFLLTWIANGAGDVFMQLFAPDPVDVLKPASAAVQVTDGTNNGAKMAHAASAGGAYIFAWSRKDQSGNDQVWFRLLDDQLVPVAGKMLSPTANIGSVVAGASDFLVAWQDNNGLGASRIAFDGSDRTATIASNGGAPLAGDGFIAAWDMVSHNGQPTLIWGETRPDLTKSLWINPLCFAQP
jgi:hypothetical protein